MSNTESLGLFHSNVARMKTDVVEFLVAITNRISSVFVQHRDISKDDHQMLKSLVLRRKHGNRYNSCVH